LILNDKNDDLESSNVVQITHYGIFDTETVAVYELKI
jgi:hypothetical protein